jgi:hypothetical protein
MVRTVSGMVTDAEAVTDAIRGAALCTICIARKTGTASITVIEALASIGQRVQITDATARCDDCLQVTRTHTIRVHFH